jgi:hypothetical protein
VGEYVWVIGRNSLQQQLRFLVQHQQRGKAPLAYLRADDDDKLLATAQGQREVNEGAQTP